MEYRVTIEGLPPGIIMHNGTAGLDPRTPQKKEIAYITSSKRGANRTEEDDARIAELECQISLYLDQDGAPTLPTSMLRAMIEQAARKFKQGPLVREGLIVTSVEDFDYQIDLLGRTVEELGKTAQFTVPVVVQRSRLLRTRARFQYWSCQFVVECDSELVDEELLRNWLEVGGRRIGLGDWRPAKSGEHGRFVVTELAKI